MLIKVVEAFNDITLKKNEKGFYPTREAGTIYEVDDMRGEYLIYKGFAERVKDKPKTEKKKKSNVKAEKL